MEHGYTPKSVIVDAPISIGGWSPRNYTRRYAGSVTLAYALAKSINTVPVRLSTKTGRQPIAEMASRMGVQTKLRVTRSLPIGTSEVTVMDMATAGATLGSGGYKTEPYGILQILDPNAKVLYERRAPKQRERALSSEVTGYMNTMLNGVVRHGTGRASTIGGLPSSGKTGTTQDYRDAWFMGYTGNYAASVWFGNDDFSPTRGLTGGNLPAKTWSKVMTEAHRDDPLKSLPFVNRAPQPLVFAKALAKQSLVRNTADVNASTGDITQGQIELLGQFLTSESLETLDSLDKAIDVRLNPKPAHRASSREREQQAKKGMVINESRL